MNRNRVITEISDVITVDVRPVEERKTLKVKQIIKTFNIYKVQFLDNVHGRLQVR